MLLTFEESLLGASAALLGKISEKKRYGLWNSVVDKFVMSNQTKLRNGNDILNLVEKRLVSKI